MCSDININKDKKNPLRKLGRFLLYTVIFGAFLVGSTIVHEAGHALAAIIKGVKPNELIIGWWSGIGPGVALPDSFLAENLPFFRYAGGLTAGLLCFLFYVLFWVYPLQTKIPQVRWGGLKWWTGEFLLLWAIFHLLAGYFEGSRFEQYATGDALQLALIIAIAASLIVHVGMTFIRKNRQRPVK